jgi:CRISPR-associated protein Cas2
MFNPGSLLATFAVTLLNTSRSFTARRHSITVLVTYDVNTETKAGRRRLHRVAQTCKNFGQRVQFSVFECSVDLAQLEDLSAKLKKIINPATDSIRIYRLHGDRDDFLTSFGVDHHTDFDEPLII